MTGLPALLPPRLALAGEDRLGHGAAPAHDPAVGGDRFAGLHEHHIARAQRRRSDPIGRQGPGKARQPFGECRREPREVGKRPAGAVSRLELEVPAPEEQEHEHRDRVVVDLPGARQRRPDARREGYRDAESDRDVHAEAAGAQVTPAPR